MEFPPLSSKTAEPTDERFTYNGTPETVKPTDERFTYNDTPETVKPTDELFTYNDTPETVKPTDERRNVLFNIPTELSKTPFTGG
jgi:hypothetical protein